MTTATLDETWKCINAREASAYHDQRFFVSTKGRHAVADWSMRLKDRPDTTDDGLLELDPSRPAVVRVNANSIRALEVRVPVTNASGGQFHVGARFTEALLNHLVHRVGMPIELNPEVEAFVAAIWPLLQKGTIDLGLDV